jgi:hypothetical protein
MAKLKRIENKLPSPVPVSTDCWEWLDFIADISPEIEKLVYNRLGLFHYRPRLKSISLPTKNFRKIAS